MFPGKHPNQEVLAEIHCSGARENKGSGWKTYLFALTWMTLGFGQPFESVDAGVIGLATRDQNPMFQAYFLPTLGFSSKPGWQFSHSLVVTNAYQTENIGNESLVIDVENYRYDFAFAYQQDNWRINAAIPWIFNNGGNLDGLIENWHDLFGFPQGGRDVNPDNQLNIENLRNGSTEFKFDNPGNGLGDIAVSLSLLLVDQTDLTTEFAIGIDLPTGSASKLTGNEKVDYALWLSQNRRITANSDIYGLIGVSRPGKGGQLGYRLEDWIWVAQIGTEYAFTPGLGGILQLDMHSDWIKNSQLTAFGNSVQIQLGLRFKELIDDYHLDIFFSEDILVNSAPDISFGIRISTGD